MGTHVAKQNQSCTEYCASSLFFWNRNIKEVKHWKRFLRPSGSIILRPLKNVWSVRILVYKSMRSIKARGLIQNVQYLLFRPVLPLVGGQGGLQPTRNLGVQLTLLQPRGQIMPNALMLAHPDLKIQRQLCRQYSCQNFCLNS